MNSWTFAVPIAPRGAGRHRAAVIGGHARMYADPATRKWEHQIAFAAGETLPAEPLDGPVKVEILALLPRPKRLLARSKKTGQLLHGEEGLMWAPVKPDRDNIDKAVLDGLRSIWRDDCQVCAGGVLKCYCEANGKPRVIVRVSVGFGVPAQLLDVAGHLQDTQRSDANRTCYRLRASQRNLNLSGG